MKREKPPILVKKVKTTALFKSPEGCPNGLAWHNGALYSCDAGIHPGWPDDISPTHGYIFKIDLT